ETRFMACSHSDSACIYSGNGLAPDSGISSFYCPYVRNPEQLVSAVCADHFGVDYSGTAFLSAWDSSIVTLGTGYELAGSRWNHCSLRIFLYCDLFSAVVTSVHRTCVL